MSPPLAAASGGASRATGYRLCRRYCQGGWAALRDRRSTPHRQPRRLAAEAERGSLRPAGARPTGRSDWQGWCRTKQRTCPSPRRLPALAQTTTWEAVGAKAVLAWS